MMHFFSDHAYAISTTRTGAWTDCFYRAYHLIQAVDRTQCLSDRVEACGPAESPAACPSTGLSACGRSFVEIDPMRALVDLDQQELFRTMPGS
jgi:hypothetical protein